VVTRRALLGAGALLVAGCGPPDEQAASRQDVLDEQLRVTNASVALGVSRARARASRLEAAGANAPAAGGPSGRSNAYETESRALASYVQAVGESRVDRDLYGELVADAAASVAEQARRLELDPLPTAFPGEPR
jgi:hypothetical protein